MTPTNLEAEFSSYEDSYACRVTGYLKLAKIEVTKLVLKMEFLDENGNLMATENEEVLSESDAMLRSEDLLPIKFLKFEQQKAEKPYKKARISVNFIRKNAASPTYSPSKSIPITYLNGESDNMKVVARERKSSFTDALNGKETYHTVEWEFENVGNSSLKMLKINIKYLDKAENVLDENSRYVLTDGDPLLLRGQTRVLGTTLGFKAKKSELGKYVLEVEEMK